MKKRLSLDKDVSVGKPTNKVINLKGIVFAAVQKSYYAPGNHHASHF